MKSASFAGTLMCLLVCAAFIVSPPPSKPKDTPSPSPTPALSSAELTKRATPEFFVMIDPSHGGEDKGASLAENLTEKEVTLICARELRKQLEERGIPARLLRDSDQTLSLDRRAEITNEARPALYVAIHAGPPNNDNGVKVYAPALPSPSPSPGPAPAGRFVAWESAQASSLERSRLVARAVTQEIRKQDRRANGFAATLRPLNNLIVPAIAVEVTAEGKTSGNLKRQSALSAAIAVAIAQVRNQLGVRP